MAGRLLPLFLLAASLPARATPLLEPYSGGVVFVGPTSAHVSSTYLNPAAIGLLGGTHLFILGASRLDLDSIDRATISTANGEPTAGGDRSFDRISAATLTPNAMVGGTLEANSGISIGLLVHSPYAERQLDEPGARYQTAGTSFYLPTVSLGLSLRPISQFLVGVGVNLGYVDLDLGFDRDRVLDTCAALPCGVEDASSAQRLRLHNTYWSSPTVFSLNAGVLVNLAPWWFGVSFTSEPAASLSSLGSVPLDTAATATEDGLTTAGRARVTFRLPSTILAGGRRPLNPDLDLVLNFRWLDTSVHSSYDIRPYGDGLLASGVPEWILRHRGWHDSFWFEGGVEVPAARGHRLRWGARARYQSSALLAGRLSAAQIDGTHLALLGGAELRLTPRLALTLQGVVDHVWTLDWTSVYTPSAQIECNASGLAFDSCAASREGRATPTAAGSYSRTTFALMAGAVIDWW